MVCGCGSNKIENKEFGLCASCNRQRRKAQRPKPVPKVYQLKRTPLKPPKPPKPPKATTKTTKPIKQVSSAQAKKNAAIKKAYAEMAATRAHVCTGCGTADQLTHSHIIARSQRKDLEAVLGNLTYHCIECHRIWENGTPEEKRRLFDCRKNVLYIKCNDRRLYELHYKSIINL